MLGKHGKRTRKVLVLHQYGIRHIQLHERKVPDRPDASVRKRIRDSLRGLKRVTWPMSGNKTELNYTYDALADWNFAVADEMPNVTGFDLDDFFVSRGPSVMVDTPKGRRLSCVTQFPYSQLVELRQRLDA